jgi:[protein-PII] uridylyltransferase
LTQKEPDRSNEEATRETYRQKMLAGRAAFEAGASGVQTLRKRSDAVDAVVRTLWRGMCERDLNLAKGIVLVAVGGYGRRELFPYSDVDLMFLVDTRPSGKITEKTLKDSIRQMNQALWDCGLRIAPQTRRLNECERFDPANAEFTLSLLDRRAVAGDKELYERLDQRVVPKLLRRERDALLRRLAELTAARHARYGGTLFHLEPNIKDCPGGLRDVHVCAWTAKLFALKPSARLKAAAERAALERNERAHEVDREFKEAVAFLQLLRCFLHFRHERDDNTLDWQAQDAAAQAAVGLDRRGLPSPDAAYWMRLYFRNARIVERKAMQSLEEIPLLAPTSRIAKLTGLKRGTGRTIPADPAARGFLVENCAVVFAPQGPGGSSGHRLDPAHDPEIVLGLFEAMAVTGCRLGIDAEERLSQALPLLSADLEEGPALWRHIETILTGQFAGAALRSMHALGVLELLIPEFHGIDALVIRDAYHRYTVDEHTFVLIDTLHGLESHAQPGAAGARRETSGTKGSVNPLTEWSSRFGHLLRDLQQPGLLYLMALLHDTGKGRSSGDHAQESARMAENVLARLEIDGYESSLVLRLIRSHLEMSAALRRDIFDTDTVRAFAAKVQTPEALRMLTLFTYADIQAVHPDALTPWKAENLWRLYMATSSFLDRNLDEERVGAKPENELVLRVTSVMPERRAEVEEFLEGLPARYLSTRSTEQVREQFERSRRFADDPVQLDFRYSPAVSEITLITPDGPGLFANMAGALAAWGMNIITADAFSNRQGVVVDSFRFTDAFRTLEMNASERDRFVQSVHDVVAGTVAVEKLLHGRRRGRRRPPMTKVEARVDFDDEASSHSTLLQVVAQDTPGLLRALSLTLAAAECNIEVALVDTEGETAIDVFYITANRKKLSLAGQQELRAALLRAIEEHGR